MPQYCRNKGIRKPLIAGYDREFLWEIYVQFRYDKRMLPDFALLNGGPCNVTHSVHSVLSGVRMERIDFVNMSGYDRIILLTTNRFPQLPEEKTIYFDTLLSEFIRYVYAERPLYSWIRRHRGVNVVVSNVPLMIKDENMTQCEKKIAQKSIHQLRGELERRNGAVIETRFDRFGYSNEEVYSILALSDAHTNPDGASQLVDNDAPLVAVENNRRKTAHQDGEYRNTIYCMGTCTWYGIGAPWNKTAESYLQEIINRNGHEYLVENVSQYFAGRYQDIFYNLERLPVKDGDIVIICLQNLRADKIPFFDCMKMFCRPHEYGEVFADEWHLNENGYRILAEKLYKYLLQNNFFKDYEYGDIPVEFPIVPMYGIPQSLENQGLAEISGGVRSCLMASVKNLKSIRKSLKHFDRKSAA